MTDGLEADLEAEMEAVDSSDGEETVVPDGEIGGDPEEVGMGDEGEEEEEDWEEAVEVEGEEEGGGAMEEEDSGDETEGVEGAQAAPPLAAAAFAVGVVPPKRRRGQLTLREFLRTPGSKLPGAHTAWHKQRVEERLLERKKKEAEQARLEAKERKKRVRKAERQAREAERAADAERAKEERTFESDMRLAGKLEAAAASAKPAYVAMPTAGCPTLLKIRGFAPKIKLSAKVVAIAERNAGAEVWACCDLCAKWRLLPTGVEPPGEHEAWDCSRNPDPTHNFCEAIEDPRAGEPPPSPPLEQIQLTLKLRGVPSLVKSIAKPHCGLRPAAPPPSRQPHNGLPFAVVRIKMDGRRTRRVTA